MLHAVIMAGGSGTRFWPLSRRGEPKQFLRLTGPRSLIEETYDRCRSWIPADRCWVVTNRQLVDKTQEHLPEVPSRHVLGEPCGRNTAACIGLAAICLIERDPDAVMLVLPADHVIRPAETFREVCGAAQEIVAADPERLVLMGVPPTSPATGFGYIERGVPIGSVRGGFEVRGFREKPDRERAQEYLRRGTFFWNCGIFVWRADRILQALRMFEPELAGLLDQLRGHVSRPTWDAALDDLFPRMPSISIDYAVLERAQGIAVVEAPFAWDDVGSWGAWERLNASDAEGNTVIGPHVGLETERCLIQTTERHLIGTIGIKDCIIVHTPDATLVADRGDENAVRELVALLEERYERFL